MLFCEEVLRFITYFDKPSAAENRQTVDNQMTDIKELGETFKSLASIAITVVVIHFFAEIIRLTAHFQIHLKHNMGVFRLKETHIRKLKVFYFTHFLALYSTFLSIYYLLIPAVSLMTTQFYISFHLRPIGDYHYWLRHGLNAVKAVVLVYLWAFGLIWTTVDKEVLDVYHSEIRVGPKGVTYLIDFCLFTIVLWLTSFGIQFCWIGTQAAEHFRGYIEYITKLYQHLWV